MILRLKNEFFQLPSVNFTKNLKMLYLYPLPFLLINSYKQLFSSPIS